MLPYIAYMDPMGNDIPSELEQIKSNWHPKPPTIITAYDPSETQMFLKPGHSSTCDGAGWVLLGTRAADSTLMKMGIGGHLL